MGERKMKITDVARAIGVNRSAITALYREEAVRVDLSAVDRLCRLFDCKVADLFEFVEPDE
jgi:putative transcriptional regulator